MRVYLVGITCVGKTTTGRLLAERLGYDFVDFDEETKREFKMPLLALHNLHVTNHAYRIATRPLLERILREHTDNVVIAMPPGGLFAPYKSLLDQQHPDVVTVWLKDRAENVFNRLIFTDDDDNLIEEEVIDEDNADYYLRDIRADIEYYRKTHSLARIHFDVAGRSAEEAAAALADELRDYAAKEADMSVGDAGGHTSSERTHATKGGVPAFTFRLTVYLGDLTCWREVRVPRDLTFHQLHWVIQDCIHWDNSHLYDFQYKQKGAKHQASLPDYETGGNPFDDFFFAPRGGFPVWHDSRELTIDEYFVRGRTAHYTYDYGDNWEVEVRKLDSKPMLPTRCPVCLAGEGDNPPDDVGGVGGFYRLVEETKRRKALEAGLPDPRPDEEFWFDAEYWEIEPFNLDEVNRRLRRAWGD